MESPLVTRIFRRLFAHEAHCPLSRSRSMGFSRTCIQQNRRRSLTHLSRSSRTADKKTRGSIKDQKIWQDRTKSFPEDRTYELKRLPVVTAEELRSREQRPRRVKMLLREFIEDSLYNPNYGYFPKEAVIFSPRDQFDFRSMTNEPEFDRQFATLYAAFEDALDKKEQNDTRQLWHTPTELFKPYYGEAMARYMVTNYKLTLYPYYDLIIYEMGAGNGTLMINILDYIRDEHPEVYERTKYKVIEISSSLASLQTQQLHQQTASSKGHSDKVTIINKSIFDWDEYVASPCFFVALEVFDNFAHDAIRYDARTAQAEQCHVVIDGNGDYFELYDEELDSIALRYLQIRDIACSASFKHPLGSSKLIRQLRQTLPGSSYPTAPEYIPTRLMQFFDILHDYFPAHRLLCSDFNHLPTPVPGINAPVVQTRYQRRMVQVTTPLVYQGYFDIMFPTDFKVVDELYRAITGKLTRVSTHADFLRRWSYVEDTETRSGENPMLSWYKNASVMVTL